MTKEIKKINFELDGETYSVNVRPIQDIYAITKKPLRKGEVRTVFFDKKIGYTLNINKQSVHRDHFIQLASAAAQKIIDLVGYDRKIDERMDWQFFPFAEDASVTPSQFEKATAYIETKYPYDF